MDYIIYKLEYHDSYKSILERHYGVHGLRNVTKFAKLVSDLNDKQNIALLMSTFGIDIKLPITFTDVNGNQHFINNFKRNIDVYELTEKHERDSCNACVYCKADYEIRIGMNNSTTSIRLCRNCFDVFKYKIQKLGG